MKRFIVLLAVLLVSMFSMLDAQQPGGNQPDVFVPLSLSTTGVGALTARPTSTTYADTTKSIEVRGYAQVFLVLRETASDTANFQIYYRGSNDGVTYPTGTVTDGAWQYADSINWKPSTNDALFQRSILLPEKGMGFKTVQFMVYSPGTVPFGAGTGATASAPKLSYTVVRKFVK